MKNVIRVTICSLALTFCNFVLAKECSEIQWSENYLKTMPKISLMCQAVEVRDGQNVVKVTADFIRTVGYQDVLVDVHLNDGSKERIKADSQGIKVNGMIDFDQLPRGYEMTIYLPEGDRFSLLEVNSDITEDKLIAARTLPKTAANYGLWIVYACVFAIAALFARRVRLN